MHNDITIRANVPWRPCTRKAKEGTGEGESKKEIAFFADNACALGMFPRYVLPNPDDRCAKSGVELVLSTLHHFLPQINRRRSCPGCSQNSDGVALSLQAVIRDVRQTSCRDPPPVHH